MTTEYLKTTKRLTIQDIAKLSGVSKAAVSGVLNQKPRVGKVKQDKILEIVKKYNYVPQVSARALSTKRTYQIGYLVSSKVTLGLANSYFATIHSGVSDACSKRGYHALASTYDLSSIKNFIMPKKIRQCCVDGLIIAGTIAAEVIEQLNKTNIPYIIIGREDYPKTLNTLVLNFDFDFESTYVKIINHHYKLGHRRFCLAYAHDILSKRFESAVKTINRQYVDDPISIVYECLKGGDMFIEGRDLAHQWMKKSRATRFTTFIGNDQASCGFLAGMVNSKKMSCPEDISIFSPAETPLCQWNSIPISTLDRTLFEDGIIATDLIIDFLEKKKTSNQIKEALLAEYRVYDLIIRDTTGKVPRSNAEQHSRNQKRI
jgi:LacI family transcriptional regulator, galactose operon repressor